MNNLSEINIRLKADTLTFHNPIDVIRGELPQFWKGDDIKFTIGVFKGDDILSVSNYASISLAIRKMTADGQVPSGSSPALMQKTSSDLDDALSIETWENGSKAHATITFSSGDSNITPGDHWLSIWATSKDATPKITTLCAGIIRVLEVGGRGITLPPEPVETYYTADECNEKFLAKTSVSTDSALGTSDLLIPSQKAVKSYVDSREMGTSENTVSNIGSGDGLFKGKVGSDLQFKSLKAGENVTITPTQDELIISVAESVAGPSDPTPTPSGSQQNQFLNNCILSAPNGVASYSGSTISVKAGLELLISNGRSADGCCDNIHYTLDVDEMFSGIQVGPADTHRCLFLCYANGVISVKTSAAEEVIVSHGVPNVANRDGETINYFDIDNNIWKVSNNSGQSWQETNQIILGRYDCNGSAITKFTAAHPLNIWHNFYAFEVAKCCMPGGKYVDITPGETETIYTSPVTGWVTAEGIAAQSSGRLTLKNEINGLVNSESTYSSNSYLATCLPVMAGDNFSLTYSRFGDNIPQLKLIYSEGNLCI